MKKAVIVLVFVGLMIGISTAVVGHNNSGEGDAGITSSSSASATESVSEDGTQYKANITTLESNQNMTYNEIEDVSHDNRSVKFNGTIAAGTPCHSLSYEVNKTGENKYVLNIQTVRENTDRVCAEVVTGISYEAEFEAESGFQLEVHHDGEEIETLENREKEQELSLFQKIIEFLGL